MNLRFDFRQTAPRAAAQTKTLIFLLVALWSFSAFSQSSGSPDDEGTAPPDAYDYGFDDPVDADDPEVLEEERPYEDERAYEDEGRDNDRRSGSDDRDLRRDTPPPAPGTDTYPDGLITEQILWGAGIYFVSLFPAIICPPLALGAPFAAAYAVSEVASDEGYVSDWLLPGLAAFGAILGVSLVASIIPFGMVLGGIGLSVALQLQPNNPLMTGINIASSLVSLVVALTLPFVAGATAAFVFQARAERVPGYRPIAADPRSRPSRKEFALSRSPSASPKGSVLPNDVAMSF